MTGGASDTNSLLAAGGRQPGLNGRMGKRSLASRRWGLALFAGLAALAAAPASAEAQQDLNQLSIEELADLPVRSASKREEPLSGAPTALYVITADDIHGSAATSLPEVLRLAPNLHVQRTNAYEYSVSARGFAGIESSNKLLVLVDGRTIYSTLHSGVFWELHAPLLEDVEQVEVISGPGGTLYGPNAVNGVISVISKDARDTVGVMLRGTGSANERTAGGRIGLSLGGDAALRLSANFYDREDQPDGLGPDVNDAIRGWQAGFRLDAAAGSGQFTVQGDLFDSKIFQVAGDGHHGRNLLARWSGPVAENATVQVQSYYDYFGRQFLRVWDSLETFDLDTQLNLDLGSHDLVAGFGVRTTRDTFVNNANAFALTPLSRRLWIINGYVQDRFALAPDVSLIAGVKLEHSTFAGLEVLPNLRIAWQPSGEMTLWASVSRAVRTPSRIDRDLNLPGLLSPAPGFASEKLIAFEAGYRGQPWNGASLSVSLFYNLYDDLRSAELVNGTTLPLILANGLEGENYGIEIWGNQQITPGWRVSAGLILLEENLGVAPGRNDFTAGASLGDDPPYQLVVRSDFTLAEHLTLDLGLRVVGALGLGTVPAHAEGEARIGWQVSEAIELFVAGANLFDTAHAESSDDDRAQLAERNVSVGARLKF